MATHSYSFGDHLRALELFQKAKQDVRLLVEQGIEAAKAFDLVVLAYAYNPLMLRFYAPALHAWAMKPVPAPPPPEPVKTYYDEYLAQTEQVTFLLNVIREIQEEFAQIPRDDITAISDPVTTVENNPVLPLPSSDGSRIPPTNITALAAGSAGDGEEYQETTPISQELRSIEEKTLQPPLQEQEQTQEEIVSLPITEPGAAAPGGAVLGRDTETNEIITISDAARLLGMGILGDNGTGKSTLLVQVLLHAAQNGQGFFFLDPTGAALEQFLLHCPNNRLQDIVFIEPGNTKIKQSIGLNLITRTPGSIDADAAKLMDVFKRLWGPEAGDNQSWGPRMENLLRSSVYTFLYTGLTLAELPHFLKNAQFRKDAFSRIPQDERNIFLEDFWETDYEPLSPSQKEIWAGPILNKVFALLTAPAVMHIIAQPQTTIDFRSCIDTSKIILVHLSENLVGRDAQRFIGTILIAELIKAVRSRDPGLPNPQLTIAIDEYPKFASSEFVEAVPELRKYGCGFILLGQFFKQLEIDMQGAFKQMATQVTFRVAPDDAAARAWLYRREPKSITREVEIKLPAKRPIDFLVLSGRPHSNQALTSFFYSLEPSVRLDSRATTTTPGEPISKTVYEQRFTRFGPQMIEKHVYGGHTPAITSPNERTLDELNTFFYTVMITKDAHMAMPIDLLMQYFIIPSFVPESAKKEALAHGAIIRPDKHKVKQAKICLLALGDEDYPHIWQCEENAVYGYLTNAATEERRRYLSWLDALNAAYENVQAALMLKGYVYYSKAHGYPTTAKLFSSEPEMLSRWNDEYYEAKLQEAAKKDDVVAIRQCEEQLNIRASQREKFQKVLAEHDVAYLNLTPHDFTWKRDDGNLVFQAQGKDDKTEAIEQEALRRARENKTLETPPYPPNEILSLVIEKVLLVRQILTALVADPILVSTGEMETIETGKQPVQDAVNEMAGYIIDLPNYTAYIRLGTQDNARKPCVVTFPLPAGVSETNLVDRKTQAHEQTVALGFALPTKHIQEEIKARRAQFGIGNEAKKETKTKETKQQEATKKDDGLGKQTVDENIPIETSPVVSPVVSPLSLSVSRAGSYAPATLPATPHLVALASEKTTPDTYALLLYHFAYLNIEQAVLLTGKKSSKNNERVKINKLITDGFATSEDAASGKKAVYSLTTKGYKHVETTYQLPPRKKGNLAPDTLTVNDMLIHFILAARQAENITLADLAQEKVFEQQPIKLPGSEKEKEKGLSPDGLLTFRAPAGVRCISIEVDSGSEQKVQVVDKISKYLQAFQGPYQERVGSDSVTVVFCIPGGTEANVARLLGMIEAALKENKEAASLFLVGSVNMDETPGDNFYSSSSWSGPFATDKHALIEG